MTRQEQLALAIFAAIGAVPTRESLLERMRPGRPINLSEDVDLARENRSTFGSTDAVTLAEAVWDLSQDLRRSAVFLLRTARQNALGDFDVDVLELRLDERLRKEADKEADGKSEVLSYLRSLKAGRLHFFCQGMEVGFFLDESYPTESGVHRYMPYRGPGHLEMGARCEQHGEAPCYHWGTDPPTHFTAKWIDFGLLMLSDFSQGPLPDHFDLLVNWGEDIDA